MNNKSANKQACKPTLPKNKLATTVAVALLACAVQPAQANPVGGTVVDGHASFAVSGNTLTVTNTPGTIINWQNFSIGANEVTQFAQQTAASAVLNRVISNDPSNILGAVQSNGRVFLINPNGILFGAGAKIDVAGLVASTLNLSNADFLAGRGNYTQVPGAQNISNAGHITAHGDGLEGGLSGGQIYLIAPNVENTGIITAANGEILLAAGHSVELVSTSNPNLRVNITAPAGDATNVGQLIASSGSLGLFGTVVKNSGTVSANSATMQGGKIVFKASQRTEIAGTVSANGSTGGTIAVLGSQVGLMDGATVTANGDRGGGVVLVGGDYQGRNPDVANAQITYVAPTASISADGGVPAPSQGGVGNGGKVIVWADDTTRVYGNISAKGGMNGGFVETSGKRVLDAVGIRVNADAGADGSQGQWLLDLSDITVIHSTAACKQAAGGIFNSATETGTISDANINATLNGGANVTIQTSVCTAGGDGTIVVNGMADAGGAVVINNTAGLARTITFNTAGTINIHAGASIAGTANNPLNVTLNATGGNTIAGTINNSGGTTILAGASTLSGTISNGTLTGTILTSNNGTLNGVTLGSNLTTSGNLNIVSNLALWNGVTLTLGANNWLNFNTAIANITTPASAAATITMAGGGLNRNVTGQVLTIGAGVTVNGTGSIQSATLNGTLVNNGAINTSAMGGVVINHGTAINNGAMNVTTGTMNVGATTFTQAGTVNVASGTTFLRNGGFTNAGTLSGAGTIDVGATNAIINNGIISLGGAGKVGTLTVNGNLVMGAAGSVNIDLDAPLVGGFDVLNVSGTATLAGTLNLSGVGVVGAYPVLTTTGLGATRFATINSGTFTQTPTYTATNLTLNVTANSNPLTALYWTGGAGTSNWADGFNWSSGLVPIATSNIYIGPTAGTVTIAAGAQVGNALTCDANLALSGGSLTLTAASSVNGILTVSGGTLTSAIALSTPALNLTGGILNGAGSLAVTTSYNQTLGALGNTFTSINITQAVGNLTVGAMGTTGAVNLTAPGSLTINGSITAASITAQAVGITLETVNSTLTTTGAGPNAIVLDAGAGKFINTGNAAFNVPNGRWLVYSSDPASDTLGGLASGNLPLWGKTYANYAPANVTEAGNRYLFSLVPALNVSAGAHSKIYGVDLALSPPTATVTGLVDAAAYGNVFLQEAMTGAASITSPGFAANAGVKASPYVVNVAAGTFVPPAGYGATTYTNGSLKVNPASLIVTANAQGKVYGAADPVLTYAASGFQVADTAATVLVGALTRAGGENVGSYAIGQGTLAVDSNYILSYTGSNLVITPATLMMAANAQSKVYGSPDMTLTYTASGFKFTDTAATALVGALSRVVGENVGSYAIGQGTLAANSNYTLSYTGSNLAITPATLMVAANAQSKVYGSPDMALTYTASGFKFTDTAATVLVGALTRAGGENVGSYAIGQGTLAADSNYTLSYTGSNLAVTPAVLTVSANAASKIFSSPDPLLTYTVSGLQLNDTATTVLNGEPLSRAAGDMVGSYAINQGALGLITTNYTLNYVPGNFTILVPVMISEIVDISNQSLAADEKTESRRREVLADTGIKGSDIAAQSLPICR